MNTHAGLLEIKHIGISFFGTCANALAVKTGFIRASGLSAALMTFENDQTIIRLAMARYTTLDLVD